MLKEQEKTSVPPGAATEVPATATIKIENASSGQDDPAGGVGEGGQDGLSGGVGEDCKDKLTTDQNGNQGNIKEEGAEPVTVKTEVQHPAQIPVQCKDEGETPSQTTPQQPPQSSPQPPTPQQQTTGPAVTPNFVHQAPVGAQSSAASNGVASTGGGRTQPALESHFMQQQSQIFVFSTELANKAADSVLRGHCKSIIAYHIEQPGTKKFLEKHPLKTSQFNRPPGMYQLTNMRNTPGMKNQNMMGMPPQGMMGGGGSSGAGAGDSHTNSVAQWVQEQNAHLQQQGMNVSPDFSVNNSSMPPQQPPHSANNPSMPQQGSGMMSWQQQQQQQHQNFPNSNMQNFGPVGAQQGQQQGFNPSGGPGMPGNGLNPNSMNHNFMHVKGPDGMNLMQSKVPNENLTPEQLQRREEHLASLRKIQAMLFGDRASGAPGMNPQGGGGGPGGMMPGGGPNMGGGSMYPPSSERLLDHMTPPPPHDNMMTSPPGMMSPTSQMMMLGGPNSPGGMPPGGLPPGGMPPGGGSMPRDMQPMCGPDGMPINPHNMTPAQREWMRLQQEFVLDKRKHRSIAGMPGMPPGGHNMQNSGQGPPPPYFSTVGQRRPGMPRSSPPSPNMPLGSPHMSSGHPSPLPGDPHGNFMFPGQRRPSYGSGNHPGMMPGFPPGGPGTPGSNFDPNMPMTPMDPALSGAPPGPGGLPGPGGPIYKDRITRTSGPNQGVPNQVPQMQPASQTPQQPPTSVSTTVPPQGKMNNQPPPVLQRAGNPEHFQPESLQSPGTPTSITTSSLNKPPPTYAQSTKRKRANTEDLEDLYKKLQPAPSPQQINYLNQFEGQELTITKQRNAAYRDISEPSPKSQSIQSPQIQSPMSVPVSSGSGPASVSVASPMPPTPATAANTQTMSTSTSSAPTSNQPATSTPSNTGPVSSSGPGSVPKPGPSPLSSPGPVPPHNNSNPQMTRSGSMSSLSPMPHVSGAGQRLSHYDPLPTHTNPASHPPPRSGNSTPTANKTAMSNITSASLANLAKGVEHLSNQMQQNMMQGGPFHNIQIQGQMSDISSPGPPPHSMDSVTSQAHMSPSGAGNGPPSVNNTFVNATMSIQQLNIQSVNQAGITASMPVQQMNPGMDNPAMGSGGMTVSMAQQSAMSSHGGPHPGSMPGGPGGSGMQAMTRTSMSQSQSMMCAMASMPDAQMNSKYVNAPNMASHHDMQQPGKFMNNPPTSHMPIGPNMGPNGPRFNGPGMPPHRGSSPGMLNNRSVSPVLMNSASFRQSAAAAAAAASNHMGNANVQIQAKTPNTIQYLPASPPMSQSNPMPAKRAALDPMIQRFGTPMPGMDGKVPTSKLQYLPNNGQGPVLSNMGQEFDPFSGGKMGMGGPMGMHPSVMMPGGSPQGGPGMNMQYSSPTGMSGHPNPNQPMMSSLQMMQSQSMHTQQMDMQGLGPGLSPGPMMNPSFPSPGGAPDQMMMMRSGNPGNYDAQFQQFQHQLYAQGRTRQMGPAGPMGPGPMVGPGGIGPGGMGPGPMGPSSGMHPGMNPNMGPSPGPPGMMPGGGHPGMGGHGGMMPMMGGMMPGMGGNPNMGAGMPPGQQFMNMMP